MSDPESLDPNPVSAETDPATDIPHISENASSEIHPMSDAGPSAHTHISAPHVASSSSDSAFSREELEQLSNEQLAVLIKRTAWKKSRSEHQIPPEGDWWTIWMLLAGRGAGKTRTAAETIWPWAYANPNTRWLVSAPTHGDVRDICFEGESGLLNVMPPEILKSGQEGYSKTLMELRLKNGSIIKGIGAEEPDRFRGPQFHGGWLDEMAAWQYPQDSFDMLMFGMRLGKRPKIIITTTPRPIPLVRELVSRNKKDVHVTRASTYANIHNLAPTFRDQIMKYEGTKLGQQEIHAEILNPEDGGIIKREDIRLWPHNSPMPDFSFIVMSLDTAYTDATAPRKKNRDGDPTASSVWGIFNSGGRKMIMLLDCWEDRLGFPELLERIRKEMKSSYGNLKRPLFKPLVGPNRMDGDGKRPDVTIIEDKGSGISIRQTFAKEGIAVHPYNPGRSSKTERLHAVSPLFAAGLIWVPESQKNPGQPMTWAQPLIGQLCTYSGKDSLPHDDFVDSTSQALRYLSDRDMITAIKKDPDSNVVRFKPKDNTNPYAA